jgi:hypothetical protein
MQKPFKTNDLIDLMREQMASLQNGVIGTDSPPNGRSSSSG